MPPATEAQALHVPFPTDRERTPGLAFTPATAHVPLPASAPWRATRPDAPRVVAALVAVVHRYTEQETIALDLFGLDRRGGAVACRCAGELSFEALVAEVRAALDAGAPALDAPGPASNLALSWEAPQSSAPPGPYDLHLVLHTEAGRGGLSLIYNQNLFTPSTVGRLLSSIAFVLEGLDALSSCRIDELPILDPAARRELAQLGDGGASPEPPRPVLEAFEAVARRQPRALAARALDRTLSYGELDERAERLAGHLRQLGLRPGEVVAVCVKPGLEIVVALLGLFKARLVYLPLDPTHPAAFLQHMLEEARPRLVLLQAGLASLECFASLPTLPLDRELPAGVPLAPRGPELAPRLDDVASIFYTSGTTGRPKGVVATHGNLAHFIHGARRAYGFVPGDVFSSIARYSFSISLFDLLSPLCVGASVRLLDRDQLLAPERLSAALEEVTVVHAGPSLLTNFFRYLKSSGQATRTYPGIRHLSSGGDLVSASVMEDLKRVFPGAEVFTIYGCTEISCMGTTFAVRRDRTVRRSFVGRPFPDVGVRVLDARQQPVPIGVVGEIWFRGPGLTLGYLHRPELDAEKFVELEGRRFYRTGDVGRLHEGGDLEILGRRDQQIQLRGIRVELAGVENTVRELGLAAHCAFVHKKGADDERLVAFVVDPRDRDIQDFRRVLSRALPDSMLPQHLVVLDKLPVTPNGKLDRRALDQLPWNIDRQPTSSTPPRTDQERGLAEIFSRLLERRAVGVDQSFFDLGGHSLLAVMAIHDISAYLGRPLRPQMFFENPSIAGLLQALRGDEAASATRPILLNEHGGHPPLFMLSGLHLYRPLARALEGRFACFGVFADAELGPVQGREGRYSVEDLAREYLRLVRLEQPHGPYNLLGYSFAGLVTYELAQQLRREGETVRRLILLDATLPEWLAGWRFRARQVRRLLSAPTADVVRFGWNRLRRRRPGRSGLATPRYAGERGVGALEAQRDAVNDLAAASYYRRLAPHGGRVLVIASRDRLRADPLKSPACGWEPFIPRLEVRGVPGDHFQMIEEEESVARIARFILELRP
jgi:amino acid adenylation domain-containing protein